MVYIVYDTIDDWNEGWAVPTATILYISIYIGNSEM